MSTEVEKMDQLRIWIDALIENTLEDDDRTAMNELLRNDEVAVQFYVDYMALSADLHRVAEENMPPEAIEIALESELSKRYYNKKSFNWGAAAAAVFLIGFIAIAMVTAFPNLRQYMPYLDHFNQQPLTVNFATVTEVDAAQLNGKIPEVGLRLGHQEWTLEQGTIRFRFEAGTVTTVSAPARFQLTGYNSLSLLDGRTVAEVPQKAIGYTIETPDATVVDLGTRFGVSVASGQATEVHVFTGKVHARISDAIVTAPQVVKPKVNLVAGEAAQLTATDRQIVALEKANESLFTTPHAAFTAKRAAARPPAMKKSPYYYFEDFKGSSDLLLTGSQPDEGPENISWSANAETRHDGRFEVDQTSYALLPFTPKQGHTYTFSIEVYPSERPQDDLNAFTFGLVSGKQVPQKKVRTWHEVNPPRAWMQLTHSSLSVSNGPSVENFKTRAKDPQSKRTLKLILDTTGSAWKVSWHIGNGFATEKVFEINPEDISAVSFGTSGFGGAVANFKLLVD